MGSVYFEIEDDNRVGHYDKLEYNTQVILGYIRSYDDPEKSLSGLYQLIQLDTPSEPRDIKVWTRDQMFNYGAVHPTARKMRLTRMFMLKKTEPYDHPNSQATRLAGRSDSDPIRGPVVLVFQ